MVVERQPERAELGGVPTCTERGDDATATQLVERCEHAGEDARRMKRRARDERPELDTMRDFGKPAERGEAIPRPALAAPVAAVEQVVADRTQDLWTQKSFLRQIIDICPSFVFVKDLAGRFTLVNRTIAEAHARPPGDLIGKTPEEVFLDAGEAESFRCHDLEVIRTSREYLDRQAAAI